MLIDQAIGTFHSAGTMSKENSLDRIAKASKKQQPVHEQRLLERVQAIKEKRQPLTLLSFLQVLLSHHCFREQIGSEKTALAHAAYLDAQPDYLKKQKELAGVLKQIAQKRRVTRLPEFLRGKSDTAFLKRRVNELLAEVEEVNEGRQTQPGVNSQVQPDWFYYLAGKILDQLSPPEPLYDWPETPWKRIVGKLIGMLQVEIEEPEAFIREWIASEAEFEVADARTTELARLSREGVQWELLEELRRLFPNEAKEWFGEIIAFGNSNPIPKLSGRKFDILEALFRRSALDAGHLLSTVEIAKLAEGPAANPEQFKTAIADLKRENLIDTKRGRSGGCWLTPTGTALIKQVRNL